jgi:cardiolipin synthase
MKLFVQPDAGLAPLLKAIGRAREQIAIVVFRFDQRDLEKALEAAVRRGVQVRALIAHTNHDGEKQLRQLEQRWLGAGMTVTRTGDDLVRYHDKLMIVDNESLYVLGFNYTHVDMARSRSFGLMTKHRHVLREAAALFDADVTRQPYKPGHKQFIVSPVNARERLAALIGASRRRLLIYDPKLTDRSMIQLLRERSQQGVKVRIIGRIGLRGAGLEARDLDGMRLHVRAILRDDRELFIGSQSLRTVELDHRREVGLIVRAPGMIRAFRTVFHRDWCRRHRDACPQVSAAGRDAAAV